MIDVERYTILAKEPLSREGIYGIIDNVRGAAISWLGNFEHPLETDAENNFVYSLACTELTSGNKTTLRELGLELKFVKVHSRELS